MLAFERREQILKQIQGTKKVRIDELAKKFACSEETIRRDMKRLEKDGVIKRFYGGAAVTGSLKEDVTTTARYQAQITEKKLIAEQVANLISDNSTLMVDSGSTAMEALKEIINTKKDITVITNSINLLCEFKDTDLNIFSTGGNLRRKSASLVGETVNDFLVNYHADIAIFGCKGISMQHGITESNEPETNVKRAMLKNASQVILIADHTKFDKVGFTKVFEFDQIDFIVTDKKPSDEWLSFLKKHDIEVIYVD